MIELTRGTYIQYPLNEAAKAIFIFIFHIKAPPVLESGRTKSLSVLIKLLFAADFSSFQNLTIIFQDVS